MGLRRAMVRKSSYNGLPNFDGLDMFDFVGLFETEQTIYDECFNIVNVNDTAEIYYVSWDSNGEISDDSATRHYITNSLSTIGDVKGTKDFAVSGIRGHITGEWMLANNSIANANLNRIMRGGEFVVDSDNGKVALDWIATQARFGASGGYPQLASTNEWSTMIICNPDIVNDFYGLWSCSEYLQAEYLEILIDMRNPSNQISALGSTIANGSSFYNSTINPQIVKTQKRILNTHSTGKEISAYLNGEYQSSVSYLGDYVNNWKRLCGRTDFFNRAYQGIWQGQTFHNKELTSQQASDLDDILNNYFNS